MKIVEAGHIYEMDQLDSPDTQTIRFINRESFGISHEGVQLQEVIRVLLDRMKYLEGLLHSPLNPPVMHHLRVALGYLEARALIRKVELEKIRIEFFDTGADGHLLLLRAETDSGTT